MYDLDQTDVDAMLVDHERWLKDPDKGKCADFSNKIINNVVFRTVDLSRAKFLGTTLHKCTIFDCTIHNAFLCGMQISDCEISCSKFQNCAATDIRAVKTKFVYCSINSCDFGRIYAAASTVYNVAFNETLLPISVFDNAQIKGTSFWGVNLFGASFVGANIEETRFSNTGLCNIKLTDVRLKHVWLHGINFTSVEGIIDGGQRNDGERVMLIQSLPEPLVYVDNKTIPLSEAKAQYPSGEMHWRLAAVESIARSSGWKLSAS